MPRIFRTPLVLRRQRQTDRRQQNEVSKLELNHASLDGPHRLRLARWPPKSQHRHRKYLHRLAMLIHGCVANLDNSLIRLNRAETVIRGHGLSSLRYSVKKRAFADVRQSNNSSAEH